jgi:hypothetical protein
MQKRAVLPILTCLALTACPAPGEGRNFERARAQAEPVLQAIEGYRRAHNAYPRALDQLVPEFLGQDVLIGHAPGGPVGFDYRSDTPYTYRFEMRYSSPGINTCLRDESNVQWECNGHY